METPMLNAHWWIFPFTLEKIFQVKTYPYQVMLTTLLYVLLGLCQGTRVLIADEIFPNDDLTTSRSTGYGVFGEKNGGYLGADVHNLGDINGDGLDDLIFAHYGHDDVGRAVVVFGEDDSTRPSMNVDTAATAPTGFQITSEISGGLFGYCFASGDFNGDDKTDILIGVDAIEDQGYVAVIWGRFDNTWSDIVVSSSMDQSVGVIYSTVTPWDTYDFFGSSVTSLGDFNNDSYDDFAVGAPYDSDPEYRTGKVYVVFGGPSLTSAVLNETNSLVLTGPMAESTFGSALASADFNNDDMPDMVVSAPRTPTDSTKNGRVYVILGKGSYELGVLNMTEFIASDSTGMYIDGNVNKRHLGLSVDGGCDVNGDGFHDVIIGTEDYGLGVPGIAVILFGKASGFAALTVANMTADDGVIISGGDSGGDDGFGQNVGFLGFVNDDLYGDYFVTYYNEDDSSTVTVFYGREHLSDFTIIEEEPYSHEVTFTFFAMNAGSHLGEDTVSVTFTDQYTNSNQGQAYIFDDFIANFLTPSPSISPTTSPTMSPSSELTECDISISSTGGAGLTWDVTDDEGDEEIASGDFGGEAMDFTLLASEEYLLFLSSDTVPAGTSITVTVNGQDTVIPLEQGLTTSTEIAGVTCEAISNKIASIDSAYSSTSVLLALLMVMI